MPYMIVKKDDEYCVYKKDENGEPEGETLGCHDTKEKAQAQIAAIWANEHGKGEKSAESGEAPDTPPVREGRVLSEKNRQLIQEAIRQTKEAIQALQDLLDSTALPAEERRAVVAELTAVRSLGPNRVGGYAMVWGGKDLYGTFFTPDTDAWREVFPTPPLLYDHGFNDAIGPEQLGRVVVRRIDNIGEWVEAELEKHEEYLQAIKPLLERGVLGFSTGAAGHLIDVDEATGHIRRWPVVEVSLTPTPAEPRTLGVHELRALRIALPEAVGQCDGGEAPSGAAAADAVRSAQKDNPNTENNVEVTDMENAVNTQGQAPAPEPEVRGAFQAPAVIKTGLGDNPTKAFIHWVRTGDKGAVRTAVVWDEGTATEGGVLVPEDYYNQIMMKAAEQSIPRKMGAMVLRTSRDVINVPLQGSQLDKFALTAEASGSYDETDDTPLAAGAITIYKFTRLVRVSEELLEDSASNVEDFLAQILAHAVAATENYYCLLGTGSSQPQGVLYGGTLGVTLDSASAIGASEIPELYYTLSSRYRGNPSVAWVMADSTEYAIRKLQATSTAGEFLFQVTPAGTIDPNVLMGKPVICTSAMPTIAASAKTLVIGDWSRFIIAERRGMTISRNPYLYQANGLVGFFASVRFGMLVAQAEAFQYAQHPTA